MKRARYSGGAQSTGRKGSARSNKSASKRAAGAAMYRQVRPTMKGMDSAIGYTAVPSTTNTSDAIAALNLIQPGTGSFNRIGRRVQMTSLRLYGTVVFAVAPRATSGDIGGNTFRMLVVYDKQPSGVLPTFADIFGTTTQDGTESSDWNDQLRYDNTQRFRVIRDKKIVCNPTTENTTGGTLDRVLYRRDFDEYITLNLETSYSGQSSPQTISDISSGALYIIYRAAVNTTGTDEINVSTLSHSRLRYYD